MNSSRELYKILLFNIGCKYKSLNFKGTTKFAYKLIYAKVEWT